MTTADKAHTVRMSSKVFMTPFNEPTFVAKFAVKKQQTYIPVTVALRTDSLVIVLLAMFQTSLTLLSFNMI